MTDPQPVVRRVDPAARRSTLDADARAAALAQYERASILHAAREVAYLMAGDDVAADWEHRADLWACRALVTEGAA